MLDIGVTGNLVTGILATGALLRVARLAPDHVVVKEEEHLVDAHHRRALLYFIWKEPAWW